MNSIIQTTDEVRGWYDRSKSKFLVPIGLLCLSESWNKYAEFEMANFPKGERPLLDEICIDKAPYAIGQSVYVRETWYYEEHMHDMTEGEPLPSGNYKHRYIFKANNPDYPVDTGVGIHGWRSPATMPKEAARLWLTIKGVEPRRVRELTEDECEATMSLEEMCAECAGFTGNYKIAVELKWERRYGKKYHYESAWVWLYDAAAQKG